jgi:AAA domain-containing protein
MRLTRFPFFLLRATASTHGGRASSVARYSAQCFFSRTFMPIRYYKCSLLERVRWAGGSGYRGGSNGKALPVTHVAWRRILWRHWKFLPAPVARTLVQRIALLGGESSGKTALAARLADELDTRWVPEYGRELWEAKGRPPWSGRPPPPPRDRHVWILARRRPSFGLGRDRGPLPRDPRRG